MPLACGRVRIGRYRIDALIDGEGHQPATEVFPGTTAQQWQGHHSLLDEEGRLTIAVGAFLVRSVDRTLLIDLGYGPGALGKIRTGRMLGSLRALEVDPSEITDIVFTHLHRDHVGWASVDGVPQFPNAIFRCRPADYAYFVTAGRGDPSILERLRPCLDRFESFDEGALFPEVTIRDAPGHTPGSCVVLFSSGTERAVVLGDVAHSPVQLLEREWNTLYDLDPVLARRTRQRLLHELEGDSFPMVAGMHFPGLRFGRLLEFEGRRQWMVRG